MPEALVPSYEYASPVLKHFLLPLMRGEKVTMGEPLTRERFWDFVGSLAAGEQALAMFQLELQRRAARLFAAPPLIELQADDLRLVAVAYNFCWFFHHTAEERRIWAQRRTNIVYQTQLVLSEIEPPRDEVQALSRHLMLRHLPRLFRRDTHLTFGALWGDLHFRGREPRWTRWPGRSNPVTQHEQVWLARSAPQEDVRQIFEGLLQRDPLTRLTSLDRLYPTPSLRGVVPALAVPRLCRYATNALLDAGLPNFMAPLAVSFQRFILDPGEPTPHKRYLARFLYNLALTACHFGDEETLARLPAAPSRHLSAKGDERDPAADMRSFYAQIHALHGLREELGMDHLVDRPELAARLAAFLSAASLDSITVERHHQALRQTLHLP